MVGNPTLSMPIRMDAMNIYSHYPVVAVALTAAILGAVLVAIIRKWVAVHLLTSHHEVAFPIFLQIGVIYAVILAFTFSMVLNELGESYKEAKIETTNLLTLAQLAPGLGEQNRQKIDATLIAYTQMIITGEWPKMVKHQEDPEVSVVLGALQKIYLFMDLQTPAEQAIYANSLVHLAQLRENRRMRIFAATEPRLDNPLILLGTLGFIVIGISYFFGMERVWAQMILTASLIFTIVSILMVIYMLSNPFSGKFSISSRIFSNTLIRLEQIDKEK